jgi:hypothetical protein
MAIIEHVEVDTLRPGMSVVLSGQEVGRLEDVLPQPDGRHALRLHTLIARTTGSWRASCAMTGRVVGLLESRRRDPRPDVVRLYERAVAEYARS